MPETYPAARIVAPKVQAHFARHLKAAKARGDTVTAALPEADVIEQVINAAFWASLRREEGYVPKISIAYLPPEHGDSPLLLEHPFPLTSAALTKIAPVVERA